MCNVVKCSLVAFRVGNLNRVMIMIVISFRDLLTFSTGVWHPPKFWASPLEPTDFEFINTNWNPQSSFYVISGTLSFKFLTQALLSKTLLKAEQNGSILQVSIYKKITCSTLVALAFIHL